MKLIAYGQLIPNEKWKCTVNISASKKWIRDVRSEVIFWHRNLTNETKQMVIWFFQSMELVSKTSKMTVCLTFRMAVLALFISTVLASSHSCIECGLTKIPSSIPQETTELYLQGNRIRAITGSSLIAITNIKVLDISKNKLNIVEQDSFSGLTVTTLVLSYNQLKHVPHIEPLAYSLTSLDLSNNRITTIEPFTFKNFTALLMLRFTANSITSLSGFSFHMPLASSLLWVYIDENGLMDLNAYAFAGMRANNLFLGYNALTEFPCMNHITMLHNIYLTENPISSVPSGCGLWWSQLRTLVFTESLLTSFDNITKYTPDLKNLVADGVSITVSNDTFRNTHKLSAVTIRDINQFPWFYANKATLRHVELGGKSVQYIDEKHFVGMNVVQIFELSNTSITHFPNLTALGHNNSLTKLVLSDNRISSVPCFPDKLKLYKLAKLFLRNNVINHICNLNFVPNIKFLGLTNNVLMDNPFMGTTNVPLLNLHTISTGFNNIDLITDSDLRIIQNCHRLIMTNNKIKQFPNIKCIASNITLINLAVNSIPDVPCAALNNMEELKWLFLYRNNIRYICPLLLTLAPKLTLLKLRSNRLVDLPDLRVPVRAQLTRVGLSRNPFRCLATLCWMLFVPQENPLLLGLRNAQCMDHKDTRRDIIEGLTRECTCKIFDYFPNCLLSSIIEMHMLKPCKHPLC